MQVGYVIEAPIWKTSYRLLMDEKEKPYLQGWAMVENPTDEDWTNVKMALVSGRPISFKMDLYNPLYISRPVVEPELFASLRPVTTPAASSRTIGLAYSPAMAGDADCRYAGHAAAIAPPRSWDRVSLEGAPREPGRNTKHEKGSGSQALTPTIFGRDLARPDGRGHSSFRRDCWSRSATSSSTSLTTLLRCSVRSTRYFRLSARTSKGRGFRFTTSACKETPAAGSALQEHVRGAPESRPDHRV